jgi:hypothetical protein
MSSTALAGTGSPQRMSIMGGFPALPRDHEPDRLSVRWRWLAQRRRRCRIGYSSGLVWPVAPSVYGAAAGSANRPLIGYWHRNGRAPMCDTRSRRPGHMRVGVLAATSHFATL